MIRTQPKRTSNAASGLNKPMTFQRTAMICLYALGILGLSACTRTPAKQIWQNPDVPQGQWQSDTGECRRLARREMEREAKLQPMTSSDNLGGGLGAYQQNMTTYDLQRLQAQVFERCMRTNGYTPASEKIK